MRASALYVQQGHRILMGTCTSKFAEVIAKSFVKVIVKGIAEII
jgi:hypothetical protein